MISIKGDKVLKRTAQTLLKNISNTFAALLVTGPRQVGKTYLLEALKEQQRRYITLDDLQMRNFARSDPRLFIQTYPPPIIIDEVQYAPELFPYIKIYIDTHRDQNGLFWLSGSQQWSLMKGIQESLAGRIALIDLLGLSYREITRRPFTSSPFLPSLNWLKQKKEKELNIYELYEIIWTGAFPRLWTSKKINRNVFYHSYLRTYIERDVRDDIGVVNELKFYDFIRAAAARTGCLLNYADLARDVEINVKTARIWLTTLERSGIIKLAEPYSTNLNQRIVKTPKLYFLDTGLCAYLTKWDTPASLLNGAMSGAILETYVFCEILKSYWHNGQEESIYFYRDSNQKEIDFILEQNLTLYPIEVKKTAMPDASCVKNFSALTKFKGKKTGPGAVLCTYPEIIPLGPNALSCPIWQI